MVTGVLFIPREWKPIVRFSLPYLNQANRNARKNIPNASGRKCKDSFGVVMNNNEVVHVFTDRQVHTKHPPPSASSCYFVNYGSSPHYYNSHSPPKYKPALPSISRLRRKKTCRSVVCQQQDTPCPDVTLELNHARHKIYQTDRDRRVREPRNTLARNGVQTCHVLSSKTRPKVSVSSPNTTHAQRAVSPRCH